MDMGMGTDIIPKIFLIYQYAFPLGLLSWWMQSHLDISYGCIHCCCYGGNQGGGGWKIMIMWKCDKTK